MINRHRQPAVARSTPGAGRCSADRLR